MKNFIITEGYVLSQNGNSLELEKKNININVNENEVLCRPIYGCMEGNMLHAITSTPENILDKRQEKEVVLGNSGVLEIVRNDNKIKNYDVGDYVIYFCNGERDVEGYPITISGYDEKESTGIMSKLISVKEKNIIKVHASDDNKLRQWASFSLKYITAWANWRVAHEIFKIQNPSLKPKEIYVFAYGGGVSLGILQLARECGYNCYIFTTKAKNKDIIEGLDINCINRNEIKNFEDFKNIIMNITSGNGASIFIDNIGGKKYNWISRILARRGVISTCGWKEGATTPVVRSLECQNRHMHVFTHYANIEEGREAINYAIKNNWFPPIELIGNTYEWDEINKMFNDYEKNIINTWFPIYKIND